IADYEVGVVESTGLRLDASVGDHALADVQAGHLQMGIGLGQFQHPAPGATRQIKHIVELYNRPLGLLGKEPSNGLGEIAVLLNQMDGLSLAVPKNIIIASLGRII